MELEQPLNMIGLLTLAGPGAVVIHAWSTPLVQLTSVCTLSMLNNSVVDDCKEYMQLHSMYVCMYE